MSESLIPDHDEDAIVEDREDSVPGGSKDHKCAWCPKIFMSGSELKAHIGSYHATHSNIPESKKKEGSGKLSCPIKSCNTKLTSYDTLCRHCEVEHGWVPHIENLRFDSEQDFTDWLNDWCAHSGRMVKRRGTRKTNDGIVLGDYHCIFDGNKREAPSTRALDKTPYNRRVPSKKLGFACPAHIRFQVQGDRSVIVKCQLQHFGHSVQPSNHGLEMSKMIRPGGRIIGRRKRRGGYSHDGQNYDECDSQHGAHQFLNEDEIEMDGDGMVNLISIQQLDQARFTAHKTCTSLDLAFQEIPSIPSENLQHVGHLIDKFHELSAAAASIESLLRELGPPRHPPPPVHPPYHPRIDNMPTKRKIIEQRRHPIAKRRSIEEVKDETNEDDKQLLNGTNEEESFMRQLHHGELVYHEDTVAEEVIVDDDLDYVDERRESKDKPNKKMNKRM